MTTRWGILAIVALTSACKGGEPAPPIDRWAIYRTDCGRSFVSDLRIGHIQQIAHFADRTVGPLECEGDDCAYEMTPAPDGTVTLVIEKAGVAAQRITLEVPSLGLPEILAPGESRVADGGMAAYVRPGKQRDLPDLSEPKRELRHGPSIPSTRAAIASCGPNVAEKEVSLSLDDTGASVTFATCPTPSAVNASGAIATIEHAKVTARVSKEVLAAESPRFSIEMINEAGMTSCEVRLSPRNAALAQP